MAAALELVVLCCGFWVLGGWGGWWWAVGAWVMDVGSDIGYPYRMSDVGDRWRAGWWVVGGRWEVGAVGVGGGRWDRTRG